MSVQHKELSGDELHQAMPKGNDADKSASPVAGDWYLAIDTEKLYVCYTDGVWEEFGSDSAVLKDADNDTKIEVEQTADEDKVRISTAGVERAVIDSNGLTLESGASVNKFSTDTLLASDSDTEVPTVKAAKAYSDSIRFQCGNTQTQFDDHVVGGTGAQLYPNTTYTAKYDILISMSGTSGAAGDYFALYTESITSDDLKAVIHAGGGSQNYACWALVEKGDVFEFYQSGSWSGVFLKTRRINNID